jgi:hypothetical protein
MSVVVLDNAFRPLLAAGAAFSVEAEGVLVPRLTGAFELAKMGVISLPRMMHEDL